MIFIKHAYNYDMNIIVTILLEVVDHEIINDSLGWNAFVRVSLRLESRSRKALEKQYLFHGSVCIQHFSFVV